MKNRFIVLILILTAGFVCNGCFKDSPGIPLPDPPDLQTDSLKLLAATIAAADYADMAFVSEWVGFAVSTEGDIFKTTDGGLHWQPLPTPVHAWLHRLQFVTPMTGFIIGGADILASGFLLKTTDAGQTWQRLDLHTPFPGPPSGMHFLDASLGYLAGRHFLCKTIDGGNTWSEVAGSVTEDFTGVDFQDYQKGYATAKSGKFFKTTNGGNSWQSFQLSASAPLGEIVTAPG